MARRGLGTGSLLLAGVAAFAYYKYSQMSEQQRKDLVNNWKQKGQKLYDDYVPENVKNMVNKQQGTGANGQHHASV
ncbi:MAG TPA: hypothetical protein VD794_13555 [Flavisolibacter sp.]|nr:hypothetical protein [Flavisolibacter sp.]